MTILIMLGIVCALLCMKRFIGMFTIIPAWKSTENDNVHRQYEAKQFHCGKSNFFLKYTVKIFTCLLFYLFDLKKIKKPAVVRQALCFINH